MSSRHYPALDGLRGSAILLVIFFHNFGFINYSVFGWLGVDLFFVLSGYLITGILLDTLDKPNYLKNFYGRRILRIFPLYYLSLIIFLLILPLFASMKPLLQYYVDHQWWLWTYLQNWLYSFNTPKTANILNHFWSLAVEEQFYLVWPFLILLLRKPKPLLWLMLAVLTGVLIVRSLLWIYKVEDIIYSSLYTFTRIDGICIGCMVALMQRINAGLMKKYTTLIVISLAALNFIFYFLNKGNDFPYLAILGYTTFAAMFGLLVNELVSGESRILNFIFKLNILRFFGKISYGLYIFHWPVFVILNPYIKAQVGNVLLSAILSTTAAFIISVISFYTFEMYFLKKKKHFA